MLCNFATLAILSLALRAPSAEDTINSLVGNPVPQDFTAADKDHNTYTIGKQDGELLITFFREEDRNGARLLKELAKVDNGAPDAKLFTVCCTKGDDSDATKLDKKFVTNSGYGEPLLFAPSSYVSSKVYYTQPVCAFLIVDKDHIVRKAKYFNMDNKEGFDAIGLAKVLESDAKTGSLRQPAADPGPAQDGTANVSPARPDPSRVFIGDLTRVVKAGLAGFKLLGQSVKLEIRPLEDQKLELSHAIEKFWDSLKRNKLFISTQKLSDPVAMEGVTSNGTSEIDYIFAYNQVLYRLQVTLDSESVEDVHEILGAIIMHKKGVSLLSSLYPIQTLQNIIPGF